MKGVNREPVVTVKQFNSRILSYIHLANKKALLIFINIYPSFYRIEIVPRNAPLFKGYNIILSYQYIYVCNCEIY